jgi:hypothetical protein
MKMSKIKYILLNFNIIFNFQQALIIFVFKKLLQNNF